MVGKPVRAACAALMLVTACVPPSVSKLIGKDDGLSKPSDTIGGGSGIVLLLVLGISIIW
jgi:hypothetical protein